MTALEQIKQNRTITEIEERNEMVAFENTIYELLDVNTEIIKGEFIKAIVDYFSNPKRKKMKLTWGGLDDENLERIPLPIYDKLVEKGYWKRLGKKQVVKPFSKFIVNIIVPMLEDNGIIVTQRNDWVEYTLTVSL